MDIKKIKDYENSLFELSTTMGCLRKIDNSLAKNTDNLSVQIKQNIKIVKQVVEAYHLSTLNKLLDHHKGE